MEHRAPGTAGMGCEGPPGCSPWSWKGGSSGDGWKEAEEMEGSMKGIMWLQPMVSYFFPFLPRSPARVHYLLSSESFNLLSLFMLPTAAPPLKRLSK